MVVAVDRHGAGRATFEATALVFNTERVVRKMNRSNQRQPAIQYVYGDDKAAQLKRIAEYADRKGYAVVGTVNANVAHDEFMPALRQAKAVGAVLIYAPNEVLDKAAANFRGVRVEAPRSLAA